MKLFPYLFQFLAGGNSRAEPDEATHQGSKSQRCSVRFFLIGVRSPNDQQHLVAIPFGFISESVKPRSRNSLVLGSRPKNRLKPEPPTTKADQTFMMNSS